MLMHFLHNFSVYYYSLPALIYIIVYNLQKSVANLKVDGMFLAVDIWLSTNTNVYYI